MLRYIAASLAALAISASGMAGCKKESMQEKKAAQSAPAVAAPAPTTPTTAAMTGEELFKQFCAACHPDGGNIINPKKTLHAAVLADYKITKPEDMIRVMRNPGPGMRKFDQATIPDSDARLIYDYVTTTFR